MDAIMVPYNGLPVKGNNVNLVLNTLTDCTSDGYLIAQTRGTDGYIEIEYYDSQGTLIGYIHSVGTSGTSRNSIFIKRGMKVKLTYKMGTHELNQGWFSPI